MVYVLVCIHFSVLILTTEQPAWYLGDKHPRDLCKLQNWSLPVFVSVAPESLVALPQFNCVCWPSSLSTIRMLLTVYTVDLKAQPVFQTWPLSWMLEFQLFCQYRWSPVPRKSYLLNGQFYDERDIKFCLFICSSFCVLYHCFVIDVWALKW